MGRSVEPIHLQVQGILERWHLVDERAVGVTQFEMSDREQFRIPPADLLLAQRLARRDGVPRALRWGSATSSASHRRKSWLLGRATSGASDERQTPRFVSVWIVFLSATGSSAGSTAQSRSRSRRQTAGVAHAV